VLLAGPLDVVLWAVSTSTVRHRSVPDAIVNLIGVEQPAPRLSSYHRCLSI
jgi:hypothetical protein